MLMCRFRLWIALFAVVLVGCAPMVAGDRVVAPSPLPTATFSPSPQAFPTIPPTPVPGGLPALVDQAVADLAARLGVPASEIEVVSAEAVTWSDGSLGCPQPGMVYIQVLIDGFRVVLKHAERMYDYHAGPSSIFLCERALVVPHRTLAPNATIVLPSGDLRPPPVPDPPDRFLIYGIRTPDNGASVEARSAEQYQKDVAAAAAAHLASRVGVRAETIRVVSSGYVEAQITSPCGTAVKTETGAVAGGMSMGVEVMLKAGEDGTPYRYIAIGGLGYYCGEMYPNRP